MGGPGLLLTVHLQGNDLLVARDNQNVEITGGTVSLVARGIGILLSGIIADGQKIIEKATFRKIGLLLDCSRNAIMKADYLKEWLRRSALMGYNQMMLYTKDTYELPDEECFGYLRGRYTATELKELDIYAAKLGIEMIGCVQTLGHLEPVLRWPKYNDIKDTDAELLTTSEKSYELINKILDFYSDVFSGRKIHLGMDETHGLGRGRYMDLNGYRRPFDIYIDHLNRIVGECSRRGIEPIIWSDMFFRMGSKNMEYYDRDALIPQDIIDKIPPEVRLVYWDYYHKETDFYSEWIRRHRKLGHVPIMASGIWTWPVFWYNHARTVETACPCIEACHQEGIDDIVFTMWGDDGGYCDWSSALAGACYTAEKVFNPKTGPDSNLLAKKFSAICDGDFQAHIIASETSKLTQDNKYSAANLLWDDPLLGIYRKEKNLESGPDFWRNMESLYSKINSSLGAYPQGGAGNIQLAGKLAGLLKAKIHVNLAVAGAYSARQKSQLLEAGVLAGSLAATITDFEEQYREQWYKRNKTFGYEVMQIRFAGQVARWRELEQRLRDLADGRISSIPELEEKTIEPVGLKNKYRFFATASPDL
jgi:hypothetical protein